MSTAPLEFGKEICQNFEESSAREWLDTNGIGGYASSTISGINTRRYHSVLTAGIKPSHRMLLVNQYCETVSSADYDWKISSHQYIASQDFGSSLKAATVVDPLGFALISRFSGAPWPVWIYETDQWKLEKSVFMLYKQNTTVTAYRLLESKILGLKLKARPLLSGRDFHGLQLENQSVNVNPVVADNKITFEPYKGVPPFHVYHSGEYKNLFYWYRNFYYALEKERGLDCIEDCWSPGEITLPLKAGEIVYLAASTENLPRIEPETLMRQERQRRESLVNACKSHVTAGRPGKPEKDDFSGPYELLLRSSDQFIVQKDKNLRSIIAGYHWFSDWGRDAFISMPGLLLATGRTQIAKDVIETFSKYMNHGIIPNYFPASNEPPAYNTADASLWYVLAVYQYWKETKDTQFLKDAAFERCSEVIQSYKEGTHNNIHLDADGLIYAGNPRVQLTWMDAMTFEAPVTPRAGKPVEIQALWFNALHATSIMSMALGFSDKANECITLAKQCQTSFNKYFWNEDKQCLYDVIDGGYRDASLRPNQIFAVSLPFELLYPDKSGLVVEKIRKHLLTPYGLRTLAPEEPEYRGSYCGDVISMNKAYHQGTVWSWLMGPFITAYLKTNHYSEESKINARAWLKPLMRHVYECGLGSISEIFDGDSPHNPRGCISQAWSVGELLRILIKDINVY